MGDSSDVRRLSQILNAIFDFRLLMTKLTADDVCWKTKWEDPF